MDLAGEPLASQPIEGPLWAWEGTLWQWLEEPVARPLHEMDEATGAIQPTAEEATVSRGVLRELVEDVRVEVVAPPEAGEVRSLAQTIELVGSVGPHLFVREALTVDAFGAHGATEVRAIVWDLRAAGPAELLTERERRALAAAPRREARERLTEADGLEPGEPALEDVELVAVWPRWTAQGLRVELQWATEACYACSDGAWSDYTVSTRVEAPAPERLAEHGDVPGWVRAVRERTPDARVGGFSRVDEPGPARVLDALHR